MKPLVIYVIRWSVSFQTAVEVYYFILASSVHWKNTSCRVCIHWFQWRRKCLELTTVFAPRVASRRVVSGCFVFVFVSLVPLTLTSRSCYSRTGNNTITSKPYRLLRTQKGKLTRQSGDVIAPGQVVSSSDSGWVTCKIWLKLVYKVLFLI